MTNDPLGIDTCDGLVTQASALTYYANDIGLLQIFTRRLHLNVWYNNIAETGISHNNL